MPDFVVVASPDRVEAWSVRRLPFEPAGAMRSLRESLRSAIADLDSSSGSVRAVYSSLSTDFCDAENVLFYNLGPSRFRRLATHRLTFERSLSVPECPTALSGPPLHHHAYSVENRPGFLHWAVDRVIASGRASPPRRTEKPVDWWWQMRTGPRTAAEPLAPGMPFALRLQLPHASAPIPALLKPLLDGLVAALQCDPSPDEEAVTRIATRLGVERDTVRAHLTAPGVLTGRGSLVRAYRGGLQWNPADDLCTACTVERGGDDAHQVRWELLAVSPHAGLT